MRYTILLFIIISSYSYADDQVFNSYTSKDFQLLYIPNNYAFNLNSDIEEIVSHIENISVEKDIEYWGRRFYRFSTDGLQIFTHKIDGPIIIIIATNEKFKAKDADMKIGDKIDIEKLNEIYGTPVYSDLQSIEYILSDMFETWSIDFFHEFNKLTTIVSSRFD